MAATDAHVESYGFIAFREGLYFDNYLVRMPRRTTAVRRAVGTVPHRQRQVQHIGAASARRCPVNCAAKSDAGPKRHVKRMDGGGARGGTPIGHVGEKDARVARSLLERFDIVLIMEDVSMAPTSRLGSSALSECERTPWASDEANRMASLAGLPPVVTTTVAIPHSPLGVNKVPLVAARQ